MGNNLVKKSIYQNGLKILIQLAEYRQNLVLRNIFLEIRQNRLKNINSAS